MRTHLYLCLYCDGSARIRQCHSIYRVQALQGGLRGAVHVYELLGGGGRLGGDQPLILNRQHLHHGGESVHRFAAWVDRALYRVAFCT